MQILILSCGSIGDSKTGNYEIADDGSALTVKAKCAENAEYTEIIIDV